MKKHFLKDEYIKDCIVNVKKEDKFIFDKLSDFFGKLFSYKGEIVYVDNNTFAFVTKTDIKSFLFTDETFGIFWEEKQIRGRLKKIYYVDFSKVYSYAKLNRLDNIVFEGVAKGKEYVKLDYETHTLILGIKNIFLRKNIKEIDEEIKQEIINDYKDHFPQLDKVLDFIVACRFSNNREKNSLYLIAPSDWGKTFFMNALKDLNVAVEIDEKFLTKKGYIKFNAMKLLKSFVLFFDDIDEFSAKKKKEIEKIKQYVIVKEKSMPEIKVPVYAKILTGINKNNINADTIVKINSNIALPARKVYKKYGNLMYFEAVKSYIFEFLEKKINSYLEI